MKIYDCFTFFNELDVLELRLMTLWDTVDYFVLCEATETHSGSKKELFFQKNKVRYEPYMSKIIYLLCDDLNEKAFAESDEYKQHWIRENHQRNWLAKGYESAQADDVILISDLDEIPRPEIIKVHAPTLRSDKAAILLLNNFWYYLNYQQVAPKVQYSLWKRLWYKMRKNVIFQPESPYYQWPGTVMARSSYIRVPQDMRNAIMGNRTKEYYINHAGWHFSYMGGIESIKYKIKSFAHSEFDIANINNEEYIKQQVLLGNSLYNDIDKFARITSLNDLPLPIQQFPQKFAHLMLAD